MKVKCIDNEGWEDLLTLGEYYNAEPWTYSPHTYYLVDGVLGEWLQSRFEVVEETHQTISDNVNNQSNCSALSRQEGGDHYKSLAIQPIEYAMKNSLNYCQANVIKYVTRYKNKNGIEDLKKAIHNIELLIEMEYKEMRE